MQKPDRLRARMAEQALDPGLDAAPAMIKNTHLERGFLDGFARGEARVTLAEVNARETKLGFVANAHVGGKLAQIGSRLVDAAAGAMAEKFFEALGAQLAARAAPVGAGAPPPRAGFGFWSLLKAFLRRLLGGSRTAR